VNPSNIVPVDSEEPIGVLHAKILLRRRRELRNVPDTVNVVGGDARVVQGLAVERDVLVGVFDSLAESL